MQAIYTDIHIHTSDDPNKPNASYDVDTLINKIKSISDGAPVLISLTDHNMINKSAYKKLVDKISTVILGVELHIKKFDDAPPYHCHMLFGCDITDENIDSINKILDKLYPEKIIEKTTSGVPNIERIANAFDDYEYLLLPHGGQSHKTFDKSTGKGHRFDTSMERSIYYNHFDGFTARSNKGIEQTGRYFKKLGIDQFTNLITCTDNYNPKKYPEGKNKAEEAFIPTWIFSQATFNGLKMALSESSRLFYGEKPPEKWSKTIGRISLNSENCKIDVEMSPGLNVVIGGSSSGKTLFVDSLVKGIKKDFDDCEYKKYGVEKISVENPTEIVPHYINQNFIITVFQNEDLTLGDIELVREAFPEEAGVNDEIRYNLSKVKQLIEKLIDSVKTYEKAQEALLHIAKPSHLIMHDEIPQGIATLLKPSKKDKETYCLSNSDYNRLIESLDEIDSIFKKAGQEIRYNLEVKKIKTGLKYIRDLSVLSEHVTNAVECAIEKEMSIIENEDRGKSQKIDQRKKMTQFVSESLDALKSFYKAKEELELINYSISTREIVANGHKLSIENNFKVTSDVLKEAVNGCLKRDKRVNTLEKLTPEDLFKTGYSDRPKVDGYDDFISTVYDVISKNNKRSYKIVTSDGKDFDTLSPGWKSAVLLDLILGYNGDVAPLIIDQPEDNLATDYINHGLIDNIKRIKSKKQIILVSHNATIPMLGDAQNVIVCKNEGGNIIIKSAPLEDSLGEKRVLDYIAEITDGGKPSIRKRVKKYDLKKYKES